MAWNAQTGPPMGIGQSIVHTNGDMNISLAENLNSGLGN